MSHAAGTPRAAAQSPTAPFLWPRVRANEVRGVTAQSLDSGASTPEHLFMETDGSGGWRLVSLEQIVQRRVANVLPPLVWRASSALRARVPFAVPTRIASVPFTIPPLQQTPQALTHQPPTPLPPTNQAPVLLLLNGSVTAGVRGGAEVPVTLHVRLVERDRETEPLAALDVHIDPSQSFDQAYTPLLLQSARTLEPRASVLLDVLMWRTVSGNADNNAVAGIYAYCDGFVLEARPSVF